MGRIEEKMESAVPRWQEGPLLAFCQLGSGMCGDGGGKAAEERQRLKGQRVICVG